MRRLVITTLILATLAAFASMPAAANAASCSVTGFGGEKIPGISDNTVNESGAQGYKCTVAWDGELQPQYESGGTWHDPTEIAPGFHPPGGTFWSPNNAYNWSNTFNQEKDGDLWFLASSSADTPACHYNWRFQLNFFGTNGFVFFTDVSPEAFKTC